jgi:hypothetical protein
MVRRTLRCLSIFLTVVLLACVAGTAAAAGLVPRGGSLLACYPGNNDDLSSPGCPCQSNNECVTTCSGSTFTCGNVTGAAVCAAGNAVNASVNGCACTNDNECTGNCNQTTHTCGGVTNAQVCSIGNGVDASANGCPCSNNNECQGVCVSSTNTCGGVVGAVDNNLPAISAESSATRVNPGSPVFDTATLTGSNRARGSIVFNLHAPTAADCTGAAVHSFTAPASGNAAYPSTAFMSAQTGWYRWVARYTGDAYNLGVASLCGDSRQTVFIGPELIFRNGFEAPPPQ